MQTFNTFQQSHVRYISIEYLQFFNAMWYVALLHITLRMIFSHLTQEFSAVLDIPIQKASIKLVLSS